MNVITYTFFRLNASLANLCVPDYKNVLAFSCISLHRQKRGTIDYAQVSAYSCNIKGGNMHIACACTNNWKVLR